MSAEPISIEIVREIMRNATPSADPAKITRLQDGSTDVYRIDLADNSSPLVLKAYADEPEWFMKKEAAVAGWIGDRIGVRVPRWLLLDDSRRLLARPFAVMTCIPGVVVRSLIASTDLDDIYRQMGVCLKRLHDIPMAAYGYIGSQDIVRPKASNLEYMSAAVDSALHRFRDLGGDADLARRLKRKVDERADIFACSSRAVLCHGDFHQGNLLALRDESGRIQLSGLIDFANATAADPLLDLAHALFCCGHEDPKSRELILAGYGPLDHPDVELALWLYTLHHRVMMWTFLKRMSIQGLASDPVGLLRDLDAMSG